VDVVVERCYPLLFLEKTPDGSFISRTYPQEEAAKRLFEVVPTTIYCAVFLVIRKYESRHTFLSQEKRNRLVEAKKLELEREASVSSAGHHARSSVSKGRAVSASFAISLSAALAEIRFPHLML